MNRRLGDRGLVSAERAKGRLGGRAWTLVIALIIGGLATVSDLHSGGEVNTCTETAFEAAFDGALADGGLVTLHCTGANRLTTVKIISKSTTIIGAAGEGTTLTGSGANRFFHILPGAELTLQNLVLSGG